MLVVSSLPAYSYPTYSWSEIIGRMRSIERAQYIHGYQSFTPMVDLVEQISHSRYAAGLFPATSMFSLVLVQTTEWNWEQEQLRIEFDSRKKMFCFELFDQPRRWGPRTRKLLSTPAIPLRENWRRSYAVEDGFPALVRFVRAKRWFVEYRAA